MPLNDTCGYNKNDDTTIFPLGRNIKITEAYNLFLKTMI